MHVTYAPRAVLLERFRQPAPKCSLNPLHCPALSVGDANFLSVSVNQSLVPSLFYVQHFSLLKLVSNISTEFFDFQEFSLKLSHILNFYHETLILTYLFCVLFTLAGHKNAVVPLSYLNNSIFISL